VASESRQSMLYFRANGLPGPSITLEGVIDEHADLSFFSDLQGPISVSLKGVRRINSFGVRSWIDAIRKVPSATTLELVECSSPVIDQLNMVAGFAGRGKVLSFYAPMICEACDVEEERLFQVADCRAQGNRLPEAACPKCSGALEVDDLEEQYLLFLREN
jgi:hypothetical protein